jgi:conjugal transfer pilus assembly protein TrbC
MKPRELRRIRDLAIATPLLFALLHAPTQAADVTQADLDAAKATVNAAQKALERNGAQAPNIPIMPNLDALPQPVTSGNPAHPIDIEAIARHFDRIGNRRQRALPQDGTPHLLAFVSFSMPLATLQRMAIDAERSHTTLVLRGMIDGDMQKTMQAVKDVIGQHKVAWFIDPDAFTRFAVTSVPSYVLLKRGAVARDCGGNQCFADGDFAKVSGDVSIDYALDHIASQLPLYRDIVSAVRKGS